MILDENSTPPLSAESWKEKARNHRAMVEEITVPMRTRKARREKHPVYDFLHTYYSLSLGRLERWHPGVGLILEDAENDDFKERYYQRANGLIWAEVGLINESAQKRLRWILNLLKLTQARPPMLACHGLHEWAMVYSGADVRHRESVPLRLSQAEIDHLVSSRPICCTHFDAFRFFAPEAAPLNRLSPTLDSREEYEQPGCIHANMDLYKWAYKCSPWVSSELLRETLFFAIRAREIDMRASPYDLAKLDYPPICIETAEGRREYETLQHSLFKEGLIIRAKLIDALEKIVALLK